MQVTFRPLPTWPHRPTINRQWARFDTPYPRTLELLEREVRFLGGRDVVMGRRMTGNLAPARVCKYCGAWPCHCGIDVDQGDMPLFSLRIERCVCRGPAIASGGAPQNVAAAVRAHNATSEHESWRTRREGERR